MSNRHSVLLVLALILALPAAADGEEPAVNRVATAVPGEKAGDRDETKGTDRTYAETIVVTATRTERTIEDLPVSVTVISQQEVESAPARTADDLLRTIPGITFPAGSIRNLAPSQSDLSMRGLGGNRALAMLDGIPLNDPYGAAIQWKKVPQEIIQQVEVVRGGTASLFGNYALGGTINLLTRSSLETSAGLNATWGSQNTGRVALDLNRRIRDGLGVGVNVLNFSTDGYIRTAPDVRGAVDIRANTHTTIAGARTDWVRQSGASGWARVNHFDDFVRLGTRLTVLNQEIMDAASGMSLTRGPSTLSARLFYQDRTEASTSGRVDAARSVETFASAADIGARDAGASFQWTRLVGPRIPTVSLGFDSHQVDATDDREFFNAATGALDVAIDVEGSQRFAGLFTTVSWTPAPRLEILASARLDYFRTFDGLERRSTGAVTRFDEDSSTQLDPRLSARFALNDSWSIRGALYRAFRAPVMRDMYRQSTVARRDVIANPELGPETLRGGEIGLTLSRGGLFGELTVFTNEVENVITNVILATSPRTIQQTQNLGASRSRGAESILTWRINEGWSLTAGYAWTDAEITDNPADVSFVGNRVPAEPRHARSLSLRWRSPTSVTATIRARSESIRYFDAGNVLPYAGADVVDLLGSFPVRRGLELYVIAENVFDDQYIADRAATDRLGDPRSINGGIRLRFRGTT